MKVTPVAAQFQISDLNVHTKCDLMLVVPMKARDHAQTFYLFDMAASQLIRIQTCLEQQSAGFFAETERIKSQLGLCETLYPFDLTRSEYQDFCISPHSFFTSGENRVLCGLELFHRYECLDLNRRVVELLDPEVDDEWLTASPSFDAEGRLCFGSTPLSETIRTIEDPTRQSLARFWTLGQDGTLAKVWKGRTGALLHQMQVAGEPRSGSGPAPAEMSIVYIGKDGARNTGFDSEGAYVNFTHLDAGIIYKIGPFDVPAHAEVHPLRPNIVYLSEHRFCLQAGVPVIHGNAAVHQYELGEDGPVLKGVFTHPDLYRMTSHELFLRGRTAYMALTGYPDTVFIVNADTMELIHQVRFREGERVNLSNEPHVCTEPTYGCQISGDGQYLFVIESSMVSIFSLDTGALLDCFRFAEEEEHIFAGHSFSLTLHKPAR